MLSIGLERLLPTRKAVGVFALDVNSTSYASQTRGIAYREGEIPGMLEIFQNDVKIGDFMTIEVAREGARFDRTA